ncbi:MAG: anaerobic ribonucleoside-triphosphate reductase activating protein [Bacteroidales bacterium]|nr:anaerobic ribonucleoside-triphosphate reductase activating protein [Lachnoclostridium sp.]MCM1384365.1 anaerobic ribonucleoside-triphosphate reductase activating protein [Lachnoclostridium sp.]MCM1464946.1 anaerobic ribonucleoside-triphosphate reductase activating protein [Bacteroidales bacterium]
MNYAAIKKTDTANGPGVRVSLFVSGCTHHCKGCFNRETWDFNYGMPYTEGTEKELLSALRPAYIRGISLLGGEPMEAANRGVLLELLKKVKVLYPEKDVWCYTGYDFEKDLLVWIEEGRTDVEELLSLVDVLVDGEFVEEKKNLRLAFRGSENQRLLDVPVSLKNRRAILKNEA